MVILTLYVKYFFPYIDKILMGWLVQMVQGLFILTDLSKKCLVDGVLFSSATVKLVNGWAGAGQACAARRTGFCVGWVQGAGYIAHDSLALLLKNHHLKSGLVLWGAGSACTLWPACLWNMDDKWQQMVYSRPNSTWQFSSWNVHINICLILKKKTILPYLLRKWEYCWAVLKLSTMAN